MDKETLAVLVRRAGLEKTFAEFPEDVEIAADQATRSAGTPRNSVTSLTVYRELARNARPLRAERSHGPCSLRRLRASCAAKRNGRPPYTGSTSYTPSANRKPRSSGEMRASASGR